MLNDLVNIKASLQQNTTCINSFQQLNTTYISIASFSLVVYIWATSKVIAGQVPACDSAHSWRLYSAVPLGNQTMGIMTRFRTQSHYPDTEPTSPCPILLTLTARLDSDTYQFYKSLLWLGCDSNSWPSTWEACALLNLPQRPVYSSTSSQLLTYELFYI